MRKKKLLFLLAAAFLVLLAGFFRFRFHPAVYQKFSWLYGKEVAVTKSENLEGTTILESELSQGNVVYASVMGVNLSSKKVVDYHFVVPKMQKCGDYLLAYDKDGTEAVVFYKNKELYHIQAEHKIMNAKVNNAGYLAVISEQLGYRGMVTVYNRKGTAVYKVYSGEKYLLDADVQGNGRRLAVCQYDTASDTLTTGIQFYKLDEQEPYATADTGETVFTNLHFMNNGKLVAVGEKMVVGYSASNGEESWEYSYDGASLQSFSVDSDSSVALVLRQQKQNIVWLTQSGIDRVYWYDGADIKKIVHNKSGILFATTRDLTFLNNQCYPIATRQFSRDIATLHMAEKGLSGAVLYDSGFDLIKVK